MIKIPCPVCCGDGFFSPGDRHVENRKEVCTRCGGSGEVDPETGQRPETSSGAGAGAGLYAARFGEGQRPTPAGEDDLRVNLLVASWRLINRWHNAPELPDGMELALGQFETVLQKTEALLAASPSQAETGGLDREAVTKQSGEENVFQALWEDAESEIALLRKQSGYTDDLIAEAYHEHIRDGDEEAYWRRIVRAALASIPVVASGTGLPGPQPYKEAPRSGEAFWAYIGPLCLRQVFWRSIEDISAEAGIPPEECHASFYDVDDPSSEQGFSWWLPLNAIPARPAAPTQTAREEK